ncbi:MAG: RsmD family RNA methyltransferase [Fermentimonas sp.]|nr:RsmD family RNA methyltransferase [Fermentimonas sp.]
MRIISGKYKSRRIQVPPNLKARPTTDFAKEGLFNVLNNFIDWEDVTALDLFSGTGSIALELVSRGCSRVVSVESEHQQWRFITMAKEKLDAQELYPLKADAFKFLQTCREQFDLIFADPPYDLKEVRTIPDIIFDKNLLRPDGILILEHSKSHDFTMLPRFNRELKYGSVHFSIFT